MKSLGHEGVVERRLSESLEGIVSGEEFVSPIPAECHGHMPPCEPAEQPCGEDRGIPVRFVQTGEQSGQKIPRPGKIENLAVVGATDQGCGLPCEGKFVEGRVGETDAERT